MRTVLFVAAAACLLAGALAECPNACSSHGTCGTTEDYCECFSGWSGNDCSQRTCQFGYSFVDTPNGDLNFDGDLGDSVTFSSSEFSFDLWETHAASTFAVKSSTESGAAPDSRLPASARKIQTGEAHFWKECSGKGTCNGETGQCECYAGYDGAACQRQSCPGSCNGHGRCMSLREAAEDNDLSYDLWDARKNHVCICDRGYSGIDCNDRLCAKGDDPMDGSGDYETQVVKVACNTGATIAAATTYIEGYFRLNITDYFGFTWQTGMLPFKQVTDTQGTGRWTATEAATSLSTALQAIPNDVFGDVVVTAATTSTSGNDAGTLFTITFPTVGDYADVAVDQFYTTANADDTDCQSLVFTSAAKSVSVTTGTTGTGSELTECSSRGNCDYTTGLCKCFAGFTGLDCSQQNALAE